MLCGIYLLKFNGTDQVYVGQSVDIKRRFTVHIRKLKQGTSNYKLQKAYELFGTPYLEILLECTKEQLNTYELEALEVYDAVDNGFNIARLPDIHLEGCSNPASKYSEEDIISVFEFLLDPYNSYKNIALATEVSEATVRHIANSEAHTWLATRFPDKYQIMNSLKGTARQSAGNSSKSKNIKYPLILSPEGKEFNVEIISAFAKEHNLDPSSLSKVLRKDPRYKTHKGWKLK